MTRHLPRGCNYFAARWSPVTSSSTYLLTPYDRPTGRVHSALEPLLLSQSFPTLFPPRHLPLPRDFFHAVSSSVFEEATTRFDRVSSFVNRSNEGGDERDLLEGRYTVGSVEGAPCSWSGARLPILFSLSLLAPTRVSFWFSGWHRERSRFLERENLSRAGNPLETTGNSKEVRRNWRNACRMTIAGLRTVNEMARAR